MNKILSLVVAVMLVLGVGGLSFAADDAMKATMSDTTMQAPATTTAAPAKATAKKMADKKVKKSKKAKK